MKFEKFEETMNENPDPRAKKSHLGNWAIYQGETRLTEFFEIEAHAWASYWGVQVTSDDFKKTYEVRY